MLILNASYRVRIRILPNTGRPRGADITFNMAGQESSAYRSAACRLRTKNEHILWFWIALVLLTPCLGWIAAIGTGQLSAPLTSQIGSPVMNGSGKPLSPTRSQGSV